MSQPKLHPPFREGHALVLGVSDYGDPRWDAPTAERDARALYETLTSPQLGAYPEAQADLLVGAGATKAAILAALDLLAQRSGPDSSVLIAFTGHGALGADKRYYLASSDARFTAEELVVNNSGVSVADLARALSKIQAKRLLLILNACFAGVAGDRLGRGGIAYQPGSLLPDEQGTELLASGEGRAILTASRADQRSYFVKPAEGAQPALSIFGQALVDGLRGVGVPDAGGYIGLFELYNQVHRQTKRTAAAKTAFTQEPILTVLQAAGPFPVARYPGSSDAGDLRALADRPAGDTAGGVRTLPQTVIQHVGAGGAAVGPVGDNSNVRVSSGLITFGDNVQAGNITIGDVAGRDIIKSTVTYGSGGQPVEADPLAELARAAERLATARNVDELTRDDAAHNLRQAHGLYKRGDTAQARARLDAALTLMRGMQNGFVDSLARKVEVARDALG